MRLPVRKLLALITLTTILPLASAKGGDFAKIPAPNPGQAMVVVYQATKPVRSWGRVRVLINGAAKGQLAQQKGAVASFELPPGAYLLGIDGGKAPLFRRRVSLLPGETQYWRLGSMNKNSMGGIFDVESRFGQELRVVFDSEAKAEIDGK